MRIPELLAPAGSIEAFLAAMDAGADACYLGLGDFNARKRAKNFTPEDLRLASAFARSLNKKIYVTLNTLVYDIEIPAIMDTLDHVADAGVNGVIVQDMGLLSLIRRYYPDIPVHASTQMFCHNSLHAAVLADMGVSRIILPRELTLGEIGAIMEKVPCEYEVFVHGALCFSFSGCCLASSRMFGDSGNRGRCRQVCRFAARAIAGQGYPFSMRDLDARPVAEELVRLGMTSLKIEGRLKPASYVRDTVRAWRTLLDSIEGGSTAAPAASETGASMRETCAGYFHGADYIRLVNSTGRGSTGEILGTVRTVEGTNVRIELLRAPVRGMKLRIQDTRGRNAHEGVLLDFSTEKHRGKTELLWRLSAAMRTVGFTQPLTVFIAGVSAPSDARRVMHAAIRTTARDTVSVGITLSHDTLTVTASPDGDYPTFERSYPATASPARSHPVTDEDFARIFSETDRYPFRVRSVSCKIESGIFIPSGALKQARRDFYREFDVWYAHMRRDSTAVRHHTVMNHLAAIRAERETGLAPTAFLYAEQPFPHTQESYSFIACPVEIEDEPEIPPSEEVVLIPPLFVPEGLVERWKARIAELAGCGYRRFMAPTYGWRALADTGEDIEWIAGPYYYAVNSFAIDALREAGITSFVVSPDIPESDIEPVGRYTGRLVAVNPPREMFATRLTVPEAAYTIQGTRLRVVRHKEYTVIEEQCE